MKPPTKSSFRLIIPSASGQIGPAVGKEFGVEDFRFGRFGR